VAVRELKIFEILKDINYTKSGKLHLHEGFKKAYNSFMVNKYLSMDCETVVYANMMNKKHVILDKVQYLFLSSMIEKKNRFLKYIKKDVVDKKDVELIKYIQDLYQLNQRESIKVFNIIDENEKSDIREMYKLKQKPTRKR